MKALTGVPSLGRLARLRHLARLGGVLSIVAALALGGCKKKEGEQDLGAPVVAEPSAPVVADPAAPVMPPSDPAAPAPADPSTPPPPTTPSVPKPSAPSVPSAPSTPSTPPPPTTPSVPKPPATPATPATPPPGDLLSTLGQPCGDKDSCVKGAECKTYYGIAGPSGPAFKSCEIPCQSGGKACPASTTCVTVADGPGSVCRPQ